MAKFTGSLQDWRRYIDEKTQAVREQQQGGTAVAEADAPEYAGPPMPATTMPEAAQNGSASDEVEAVLAKHKAIQEEIDLPAPIAVMPAPMPLAPSVPAVAAPASAPSTASIAQAAENFARLPRHIQLLMQPIQGEVAQNSYKSQFTETRDELIGRLLDPQLTLEETARILNVCPTTVRRYTNRGHLKQERTQGNHRRFRLSNVLEFLDANGASDD